MEFIKSRDRRERDRIRKTAREMGYGEHYRSPEVAKIAYNRLSIPKEEPPKWYKDSTLHADRKSAVKDASNMLRRGETEYAKVYSVWTEDGVMWGVKTYPRVIPWFIKEGLVKDTYDEDEDDETIVDRKKKKSKPKSKRPFGAKAGDKLQSFYGIKHDIGGKAGNMIQSIYRVKTKSHKPKRKVTKRK